ncbi:MAG: hypothetical protein ACMG6H_04700, partial [Acidobacteriota bacterium]
PEHLDADELNAFAEGALPSAARARYVSHLADCDNCRQMVSQLAISAGAVARVEPVGATGAERGSWPQRLAAFFTPRTLRYAAFAVVLIAAAGVVFLIARRTADNSALVARNEPENTTAGTTMKPPADTAPQVSKASPDAGRSETSASSSPSTIVNPERDESKVAARTAPPAQPTLEPSRPTSPVVASKKSAEPATSESQPSYAPPPPGETQARSREQEKGSGIVSGPRKGDTSDKYKTTNQIADAAIAKDRSGDDNRAANNQQMQINQRSVQQKRGGPRRDLESNAATGRNAIEPRAQASQKESSSTAAAPKSEEAPETRSVGGRKFRKQGNVWLDLKFKSSMLPRSVSRGSEEFSALDSGLRSIASQLSGEIIVVWKNKAYRIR